LKLLPLFKLADRLNLAFSLSLSASAISKKERNKSAGCQSKEGQDISEKHTYKAVALAISLPMLALVGLNTLKRVRFQINRYEALL
jgi:hypothetical protein